MILETRRLRLSPVNEREYGDDFIKLWSDAEVMRYLPGGKPRTPEETLERVRYMSEHWISHGFGVFSVQVKETDGFIGYCGVHYPKFADPPLSFITLLYGFAKDTWGKGVASESARAVMRYAWQTLRLPKIMVAAERGNIASVKLIERLGFEPDAEWRAHGENALHYSLCRPED